MKYRVPLDGENNIIKIEGEEADFYFLVNNGGNVEIQKSLTVLNATFNKNLFVNYNGAGTITVFDCFGRRVREQNIKFDEWTHLDTLPGCMVQIEVS